MGIQIISVYCPAQGLTTFFFPLTHKQDLPRTILLAVLLMSAHFYSIYTASMQLGLRNYMGMVLVVCFPGLKP